MSQSSTGSRLYRLQERPGAKDKNNIWVQTKGFLKWKDNHHVDNSRRQAIYDILRLWRELQEAWARLQTSQDDLKKAKARIAEDSLDRKHKWFFPIPNNTSDPFPGDSVKFQGELEDYTEEYDKLNKAVDFKSLFAGGKANKAPGAGSRSAYWPEGMKPPEKEWNNDGFDANLAWRDHNKGQHQNRKGKNQGNQHHNN